ncbi:3,4-dihydroxy 2-butanone 4-phosphate synthase / GTP cyclohydrolase II [Gordonia westfalica]|uniref:3,4-dihydroxy-2-butanone-4-phosphate synthase n=2 Tax=Gordonia westfalica TaxID=158898 RepID=A0A1H2LER9_9ACTN|nr:3,4-dihydroxy 2-butanone 4-phosphate synthase / GTP cyclohydrolase II [Gordonia westfalica]
MKPHFDSPMTPHRRLRVRRAVEALAAGDSIVVIDDRDAARTHGYLVVAAERASAENVAFMVRHTSGFLCVALPGGECDRLDLPPMQGVDDSVPTELSACVTVDAIDGVTTGISANDRARTARLLADGDSTPTDFTRPGHVVPVRCASGGFVERDSVTEAVAHLVGTAGHRRAALFATLVGDGVRGSDLPHRAELEAFATAHSLRSVSISDVRDLYFSTGTLVERTTSAHLASNLIANYRQTGSSATYLAVVTGSVASAPGVLVHVHRDGTDSHSSSPSDAQERLALAESAIAAAGCGVIIYGRAIDDTTGSASAAPAIVAAIAQDVGLTSVRLVDRDNEIERALRSRGIPVEFSELSSPNGSSGRWEEHLDIGA